MRQDRDLQFGTLGNGITVWDRNTEVNGDYQKIAHISINRQITYYVDNLTFDEHSRVEDMANNSDPNVSMSQDTKVFLKRPNTQ